MGFKGCRLVHFLVYLSDKYRRERELCVCVCEVVARGTEFDIVLTTN